MHTPDRDGLFAAIVATLDRLGLACSMRACSKSADGYALDNFQVHAPSGQAPEPAKIVETAAGRAGAIRRRSSRRGARSRGTCGISALPPQVDFDTIGRRPAHAAEPGRHRPARAAGRRRAGASQPRLRVHDARIATFGERAEDMFQISDQHDRALTNRNQLQTLRSALIACLEGEHGNDAARHRPDRALNCAAAHRRRASSGARSLTPDEIDGSTRPTVEHAIGLLESGEFRVAEPDGEGGWQVNEWLKKAVLLYFRMQRHAS